MNYAAKRIVEDRMRRDRNDYRGRDYGNDYRGRDYGGDYRMRDREREYRGHGHMEYRGEFEYDGRRGVYGTGRYGVGGRDHGEDYYDRDYDDEDYGKEKEMKLSRSDMKKWKHMLKNADGSAGEHFTAEHIHEAANQVGATFEEYDEKDLCMAANMLYSDLCEALRSLIPRDKEAMIYTKMARYWLEDEDGPQGSEKLALYYYCIVDGDE
jgi:hypothetical protein